MDTNVANAPAVAGVEPRGLTLFRIAGIRVRIETSWLFIFALIFLMVSSGYLPREYPAIGLATRWLAGLVVTLLFFASIVAHELAHSFIAIRSGIPVPDITLFLFGGVARMEREPEEPLTELRIALAGPAMSLLLALAFWLSYTAVEAIPGILPTILKFLAFANLALGIFNLLPGFPMDGGRVLRALVWWRTGSFERATRAAASAGKALAFALMVLGGLQIFGGNLVGGIWLILIGMFLRSMAQQGYESVILRRALRDATVQQVMAHPVETVAPSVSLRSLVDDHLLPRGYHAFPVAEDGRVLGLVTTQDLSKVPRERWDQTSVEIVMTTVSPELTIAPEAGLLDALQRLGRTSHGRLLVMKGDQLVGMVSTRSLSRFVELHDLIEKAGT